MPDMAESSLDLIVCGTADAITMVEAGAKVVQEDVLIEALELAHREIRRLCDLQLELREQGRQAEVVRPGGHRASSTPATAAGSTPRSPSRVSPASRSPRPR